MLYGPLPPPAGQLRRVQASALEERYASAACGSGGPGFLKDAKFIFRGEVRRCFRDHFRIQSRDQQHLVGAASVGAARHGGVCCRAS